MKVCELPNCENKHYARGMCNNHYARWRRNGDPVKVSDYNRPPPSGQARCRNCGLLPVENFHASASRRGAGMASECKKCHRARVLFQTKGITVAEYAAMSEAQGHVCAICYQPETLRQKGILKRLAVDHDHATGRIRGLLCSACNLGLGKFKDDVVRLQSAIEYLSA